MERRKSGSKRYGKRTGRTGRIARVDRSGEDWQVLLQALMTEEQRRSQLRVSDTLATLGSLWIDDADAS
jgi:hypothetical protein